MTYTSNPTVPDINELQNNMVQSIKNFSQICKLKVKDNSFIQNKINQISDQRVEFRKFAEESITHNLKMSTHADDLIVFAECCEDDGIDKDDLLELLRPLLSDSKLYRAKAKLLKNQLKRISISLKKIVGEIAKYDEEITEKRGNLPKKIDEADKLTDDAISYAKGGCVVAGVGTIAAVVAAPFTAGASLTVVPVAEAVVGLVRLQLQFLPQSLEVQLLTAAF
ncbi:hypothetical protein C1646_290413 [Rhizophagus diaphanus]|nr:hypothetical protein C1646_290413 [Rhizophagus diaphanus] [Rhizophagus sp. MUCL 43196]